MDDVCETTSLVPVGVFEEERMVSVFGLMRRMVPVSRMTERRGDMME